MDSTEGAATFHADGAVYDAFMGRYSRALAPLFADASRVVAGSGCWTWGAARAR